MHISDITIKEEDNLFLHEMNDYLGLTQAERAKHRIFIFAAYLGLDLEVKDLKSLSNIEPKSKFEKLPYNIPRTVSGRTTDEYIDLLVATKFKMNKRKISREDIQRIYDQDSFTADQELHSFLIERVLLGAKYFCIIARNGEADEKNIDMVYNILEQNAEKRILERLNK